MIPHIHDLKKLAHSALEAKRGSGCQVDDLAGRLEQLPDSYDALIDWLHELHERHPSADYPYCEPDDWAAIEAEAPGFEQDPLSPADMAPRIEAGFLGSVCGCILGKPIEVNPTLDELKQGLEALGDWPLNDYVSEKLRLREDRYFHESWPETVRERLRYAAADDDTNYTLLGMLVLEQHGRQFTDSHLAELWFANLPMLATWGPERRLLVTLGVASLRGGFDDIGEEEARASKRSAWYHELLDLLPTRDAHCGAQIRADAYGYAALGDPELAAWLSWKDARMTHRKTGLYATMFTAAAIAATPLARKPLEIFSIAQRCVPRRSRFYAVISDALTEVAAASDWLDGYRRINRKYGEFTHCCVFQETATLLNTLRFAENVGDGISKQVSQGNDTDSYGATAGAILGAWFGPGHLESRWLEPLQNRLLSTVATLHEHRIDTLAHRMGRLPGAIGR